MLSVHGEFKSSVAVAVVSLLQMLHIQGLLFTGRVCFSSKKWVGIEATNHTTNKKVIVEHIETLNVNCALNVLASLVNNS